jgi:hypothetical protein
MKSGSFFFHPLNYSPTKTLDIPHGVQVPLNKNQNFSPGAAFLTKKKTARASGLEMTHPVQAFFFFAFTASCFLFKYALRRFRFSTLLYCLPIGFFALPECFRGIDKYDD